MCRKVGLISLIALINLIGWISLASSEEEIRKDYDLKVKLKPKVIESKVYWQEKEKIDWQEEIKNWKLGLLKDEMTPPIIVKKENFYPEEEDYSRRYFWGKNDMRLLVLNPMTIEVRSSLEFSANSYKRERTLKIWVNEVMIKKIEIFPEEEFSHFEISDISLKPGVNEIRFFCLEGTEELRPEKWKKEKDTKEVSVRFKEFKFRDLEAINTTEIKESTGNIKCMPQDEFLDIIFSPAKAVFFSRDIDVDLKEFPFLNLDAEFKREVDAKLIAFLGVDYTDDGLIDGYLNLEEMGEHNLFELARDKWQEVDEYKNEFKLKKMILLLLPGNEKNEEDQIGILTLKDITLYNDNSLILVEKKFDKDQLRFEDINVKSVVIDQKGVLNLISYFDAASLEPEDDKSIEEKSTQDKKRELEEVRVFIPLEGVDWKNYPYFSFRYNLDNLQIQEIELAILTEDENKEKILNLTKNQYKKSEEEIEVNLKEINSEEFDIKDLIIRLKRREETDCSLPETKGWYQAQLSGLKLYEKFPYPIRSKQVKERFLSLIQTINPRSLKVDEKRLGLNDFEGWQDYQTLEGGILSKRIELIKGKHKYEKLENPTFDVEWAILEPVTSNQKPVTSQEPEITFKKINPTKYLVKVEGAKGPFWLVFSESFHKQWKLYQMLDARYQIPDEIIAEYPNLRVKEARHAVRFTPKDIRYLFRKPLAASHHLVNGYANGWYIEPKELGLGENFDLVIYFWPQGLFYLGLGISGITLLFCTTYPLWPKTRKLS